MPFTWQVNINKGAGGKGYVYVPSTLSVGISDEVCFVNNDDKPHWPALVPVSTAGNTTYLMPNQIAPNSSSSAWIPGAAMSITYQDSLDASKAPPTGSIAVTDPSSASAATIA